MNQTNPQQQRNGGQNNNNNMNNSYNNNNNNSFNQQLHESAFSNQAVMPISALTPNCPSWKIRAKIETKAPVREWDKGDKHFINFGVILSDKHGSKIEGTFWSESVQKFYDTIIEGKVYDISGGLIRPVNRQWAKTDHNFVLSFDVNASITEVQENIETHLALKSIDELSEPTGIADLLVKVVSHVGMVDMQTRNGPTKIKKIQVVDMSQKGIELTVWGSLAEMMEDKSAELNEQCIIAIL